MIDIVKMDGEPIFLNPLLIERLENTPDTTITLTSGKKLIVKNSSEEVLDKILDFHRGIHNLEYKPVYFKKILESSHKTKGE